MIVVRNMAKVALPPANRSEVLKMYVHKSRGGDFVTNYIYKDGIAFLPLNRTKLLLVAEILGEGIKDERSTGEPLQQPFVLNPAFTFREHQVDPAQHLLDFTRKYKYSVLKADCGTGKTVVNTWVAGHLQQKTLILVDQTTLADQWREAFEIVWQRKAQVLDDKNKDRLDDVVIATFQFLHKNPEVLKRMKQAFGTCVIDEFHVSGAETYKRILFKLDNANRIGTSATIIRKGFGQETLTDLVADVSVTMVDDKALIPEIRFIDTKVSFCSDDPNKFTEILTDLSENSQRNRLILGLVRDLVEQGRKILFVGARTKSLKYLHEQASKFCKSYLFVGNTSTAQDQAMKAGIADGSIDVVWSEKKFEKGVDAPRLDTVILGKPCNNEATIIQIIGRATRSLAGKPDPLVFDLIDRGSLAHRFANNHYWWYRQRKYEIGNDYNFFLDSW